MDTLDSSDRYSNWSTRRETFSKIKKCRKKCDSHYREKKLFLVINKYTIVHLDRTSRLKIMTIRYRIWLTTEKINFVTVAKEKIRKYTLDEKKTAILVLQLFLVHPKNQKCLISWWEISVDMSGKKMGLSSKFWSLVCDIACCIVNFTTNE